MREGLYFIDCVNDKQIHRGASLDEVKPSYSGHKENCCFDPGTCIQIRENSIKCQEEVSTPG